MRSMFVAVALVVASGTVMFPRQANAVGHCQCTECRNHDHGHPDLFYNYYVDPTCCAAGAQMYVAPVPVPRTVGQTYFTYQPLMPHEFLYRHSRSYHRYYNEGRGFTRTSVRWR